MKKRDNDIWTTKLRPVTRRDDKIAGKGRSLLSREINYARVCPRNVRAFTTIVVIKSNIALITDHNLLSHFSVKPKRELTVIALVISGSDDNVKLNKRSQQNENYIMNPRIKTYQVLSISRLLFIHMICGVCIHVVIYKKILLKYLKI